MRRPSIFKQRDVTRAARGVQAAGLDVARVQIDRDGVIVVVAGKSAEADQEETSENLRGLI